MATYLYELSYTAESIKAQVGSPQDRMEAAARPVIESVGGKLLGGGFAFGDHDAIFMMEAPDDESAAAVALAVAGWRDQVGEDDQAVVGRAMGRGPETGQRRRQSLQAVEVRPPACPGRPRGRPVQQLAVMMMDRCRLPGQEPANILPRARSYSGGSNSLPAASG